MTTSIRTQNNCNLMVKTRLRLKPCCPTIQRLYFDDKLLWRHSTLCIYTVKTVCKMTEIQSPLYDAHNIYTKQTIVASLLSCLAYTSPTVQTFVQLSKARIHCTSSTRCERISIHTRSALLVYNRLTCKVGGRVRMTQATMSSPFVNPRSPTRNVRRFTRAPLC